VIQPSCRGFLCRGWRVRRRLATSCATGYQLAAPSEAWRGRSCASTAVATHPGTLWSRSQVSQVCLRTPATACSTWTFHDLVLVVAMRYPCEPAGVERICVQGTSTPPRRRGLRLWLLGRCFVRASGAIRTPARWWPAHPSVEPRLGQRPAISHAAAPTRRAHLRSALATVTREVDLGMQG
jgi:hypothetical protein